MTIPSISYNFNDIEETRELATVVEQKFGSFNKYLHDDESVQCDVEFSKVATRQNGQIHRIEVNLQVDGTLYRADATEESFEKAIDEVRDELDKEMRRAKEKQATLEKQAGREVKEQMLAAE